MEEIMTIHETMRIGTMISGLAPAVKIFIGILIFCLCVLGVIWAGSSLIFKEGEQRREHGKRIVGGGLSAFDPVTGLPRGISDTPPAVEFISEHIIDNKKDEEEGIGML
jgi:hypothetical protein